MQRTSKTAVKLLLKLNGIFVDDDSDLDAIAKQLEEEANNIKSRIDSLISRYALIHNTLGAVRTHKLQHGIEDGGPDASSTVIPT